MCGSGSIPLAVYPMAAVNNWRLWHVRLCLTAALGLPQLSALDWGGVRMLIEERTKPDRSSPTRSVTKPNR